MKRFDLYFINPLLVREVFLRYTQSTADQKSRDKRTCKGAIMKSQTYNMKGLHLEGFIACGTHISRTFSHLTLIANFKPSFELLIYLFIYIL